MKAWSLITGLGLAAIQLAPATVAAGDVANGARLYGTFCVACHGAGGKNVMPGAPNFSRGEGLMKPDITLLTNIKSGRNAMPAFAGVITDREILDLITYLRTLR